MWWWWASRAEGASGDGWAPRPSAFSRPPPVPVLVSRMVPPGAPRRILAAVDDSDLATGVLVWARRLSERYQAPLQVIYSLDVTLYHAEYVTATSAAVRDAIATVAERAGALGWLGERLRDAGLGAGEAEAEVVTGDPGVSILEAARRTGAELIVLGSRGTGTVSRLLLGSVSRVILREAPCPVFVVPDPDASAPDGAWR